MEIQNASNKHNFKQLLFEHHFKLLTENIALHVLKNDEKDFYDLEKFQRLYKISNLDLDKMIEEIKTKLKEKGYNTFLGFGGTGLFIFTSEEKPQGAY